LFLCKCVAYRSAKSSLLSGKGKDAGGAVRAHGEEQLVDYRVFDADQHYYEAEDAFTRFASKRMQERKYVRWLNEGDGKRKRLIVGSRIADVIGNPTFNPITSPGIYHETLKKLQFGDDRSAAAYGVLEPIRAEYRDRDARLAIMDTQNVEKALLFPTLGVTMEGYFSDDVELCYDAFHAFNQWLQDDWGFNWKGRIYAAPYIAMLDVDKAVEELEWCLKEGATLITLRPGPAYGRSPADPHFDPFWARVNESGILVTYHAFEGPSIQGDALRKLWAAPPKTATAEDRLLLHALGGQDSAIMDTMLALVLHNLFGRFPNIKVASIENGAAWVPYLLYRLDHAGGLVNRKISVFGQTLADKPSEIFKEKVWVAPFPEEDVDALASQIGSRRVLMGSDWPHAESTPKPLDYLKCLENFSEPEVRMIMRDNLKELLPVE
jgi:predicted TIM-barrel fold metal-dependent hydrolase